MTPAAQLTAGGRPVPLDRHRIVLGYGGTKPACSTCGRALGRASFIARGALVVFLRHVGPKA